MKLYTMHTQSGTSNEAQDVRLSSFPGFTPEVESVIELNTDTKCVRLVCNDAELVSLLHVITIALERNIGK